MSRGINDVTAEKCGLILLLGNLISGNTTESIS